MAIASKVTITIDGKDLNDFLSLEIEQSICNPHAFRILCRREALESSNGFIVDQSIDKIGAPVNISIEGVGSSGSQLFFKGIITGLSASGNYGNAEITITGNSADILLADRPRCRSFESMTLKQIADLVTMSYPMDLLNSKFNPDNGDQFPYVVQYKENNYQFLRRLAVRHGEWFYNDGAQLILGQPPKDKVTLTLGLDLNSFDISLKLDPLNFKYVFYDYLKVNKVSSDSSSIDATNDLNDTGKRLYEQSKKKYNDEAVSVYHHLNGADSNYQADLNKVVEIEKKAQAIDMTHISGSGLVFLKLGNVVSVKAKQGTDGSSDLDYGEYLVTSVIHKCDNLANYSNSFTGIPSEAKVPPYANPNAKPWCEPQTASIVDRIDPEKLGRVKVQFFWQGDNEISPWIRVAHPEAGNNSGFHSVPGLEDEVLIGFEGGDAEKPYVMGSFHNAHRPPSSIELADVRYLRSPKGLSLIFDDRDGQEGILIFYKEKAEYCIELDIANKCIKIHSDQDLLLEAKNIKIKADNNLDISGGSVNINGDTTIKGPNVNIKGDAQVKAEGASVSIDGSALTEIKGGMVKIN